MMNYVVLMGRLTADPELKHTNEGAAFCNLTVAVERDYRKDAETKTDFIPVTAWRGTAEFIERNFAKGQMIAVHGRLRVNNYEKDGEKRFITSVAADNVFFAGESKSKGVQEASEPTDSEYADFDLSAYEEILSDADVPF